MIIEVVCTTLVGLVILVLTLLVYPIIILLNIVLSHWLVMFSELEQGGAVQGPGTSQPVHPIPSRCSTARGAADTKVVPGNNFQTLGSDLDQVWSKECLSLSSLMQCWCWIAVANIVTRRKSIFKNVRNWLQHLQHWLQINQFKAVTKECGLLPLVFHKLPVAYLSV